MNHTPQSKSSERNVSPAAPETKGNSAPESAQLARFLRQLLDDGFELIAPRLLDVALTLGNPEQLVGNVQFAVVHDRFSCSEVFELIDVLVLRDELLLCRLQVRQFNGDRPQFLIAEGRRLRRVLRECRRLESE